MHCRATLLCCINLCFFVLCPLVVLVRLSVRVQVIDGKDSSLKMAYNELMGTFNPILTHSLTPGAC